MQGGVLNFMYNCDESIYSILETFQVLSILKCNITVKVV